MSRKTSDNMFLLLSKYRTEIMGLATISIFLHHLIVWNSIPGYMKYCFRFGFIGVEIFLFLSGIGLCYSIQKEPNIKKFYYKRLIRIYPSYVLVTLLSFILGHDGLWDIILRLSGLSYYTSFFTGFQQGFWYVSFILLLYFCFPVIYNIMYSNSLKFNYILLLSLLIFPYIIHFTITDYYDYCTARVFPFAIGIFLYLKRTEFQSLSRYLIISSIIIFIILNIYSLFSGTSNHKMLIQFTMLGMVAPGFSVLAAMLFQRFPNMVRRLFFLLGLISLEFYMVHLESYYFIKTPLFLFIASILLSIVIYQCSKYIKKIF